MIVDPNTLSDILLIFASFAGAFLVALWASLIIWTYRDMHSRSRDPLVRILAALVVAVLFLPGTLIYLILRPQRTFDDEYQHSLEEEALLQTIEDLPQCPGCNRRTRNDWILCPNCQTRLKKRCHQCNSLMELPWNICPYCGATAPGMRRDNLTLNEALSELPPLRETEETQR